MVKNSIPRYAPKIDLPPYAYLPGRFPHPVRDPDGHSYGRAHAVVAPLTPEGWRENDAYRHGVDLFNRGYYWEAHEAWENLWQRAGRSGPVAGFLNALILLAAAGVKIREGTPKGARRHARKALGFLETIPAVHRDFLGMRTSALIAFARSVHEAPPDDHVTGQIVFDYRLSLEE